MIEIYFINSTKKMTKVFKKYLLTNNNNRNPQLL